MKWFLPIIFIISNVQINAMELDKNSQEKNTNNACILKNPEYKQTLESILLMNEVSKNIKQIISETPNLNNQSMQAVDQMFSTYAKDLLNASELIKNEPDQTKRVELVNQTYRTNNPFFHFF